MRSVPVLHLLHIGSDPEDRPSIYEYLGKDVKHRFIDLAGWRKKEGEESHHHTYCQHGDGCELLQTTPHTFGRLRH